jgi:hypothetical protein
MKKHLLSLFAFVGLCSPLSVFAEPIEPKDYMTNHALGCMILRECKEGVEQIETIEDVNEFFPSVDYTWYSEEIDTILAVMDQLEIEVYVADGKYFPPNNRGVYIPADNTLYLNKLWVNEPGYLLQVLRHEGWHAAQDCMAGTIDNSHVAVIGIEIPPFWQEVTENTYPAHVVPWEAEAMVAAQRTRMTTFALAACANDYKPMWETYEPTPLTREWLENNGYIKNEG